MVSFKSIIVCDIETTSLPETDHNTTKITELAFLGCEVEHLKESEKLPRVLHKLVLLFNPNKPIHPGATKVSGLSNELLMKVRPFEKEDVEIMRQFINRLPPPVCIVAHNGYNFDFPILRRALEKVKKELQNNVYCADSLKAFQHLLPTPKKSVCNQESQNKATTEVTPLHRTTQPCNYHNIASAEVTPPHQKTQPCNSLKSKHVSRELFPNEDTLSKWASEQETRVNNREPFQRMPKSLKLHDIYYYYFSGEFPDAHRAEEDSKALLSCIMRCKGFFEWMNENAVIFNSIEPLF